MFESLIVNLISEWRHNRLTKGPYEYAFSDTDNWKFLLIKAPEDNYYHFIIFIRHIDNPIEIEGELSDGEQIIKQIMDEMVSSGWTMVGMELVDHPEEINPSSLVLERLNIEGESLG